MGVVQAQVGSEGRANTNGHCPGPVRVLLNNSASPGGGGVQHPPPHWSWISLWERRKFTKGNIDLGCFWSINFWTFWVPDPPSPSQAKLWGRFWAWGMGLVWAYLVPELNPPEV